MARDHSDDWLQEESDESRRIEKLEQQIMDMETRMEALEQRIAALNTIPCPSCKGTGVDVTLG